MMKQLIYLIGLLLPFLKKRDLGEELEFTNLVKSQYKYLMEIIEKFQKDYFNMAEQLKEMNSEMIRMNHQFQKSLELQCKELKCRNRV